LGRPADAVPQMLWESWAFHLVPFHCKKKNSVARANTRSGPQLATDVGAGELLHRGAGRERGKNRLGRASRGGRRRGRRGRGRLAVGQERLGQTRRCGAADAVGVLGKGLVQVNATYRAGRRSAQSCCPKLPAHAEGLRHAREDQQVTPATLPDAEVATIDSGNHMLPFQSQNALGHMTGGFVRRHRNAA
jgi:hypothetical protein